MLTVTETQALLIILRGTIGNARANAEARCAMHYYQCMNQLLFIEIIYVRETTPYDQSSTLIFLLFRPVFYNVGLLHAAEWLVL